MDEGNPVILDALGRIGDIIEEVTATLLDQLDVEQAAHDTTRGQLRQVQLRLASHEGMLQSLRYMILYNERIGESDRDTMAKIRGLLHG